MQNDLKQFGTADLVLFACKFLPFLRRFFANFT